MKSTRSLTSGFTLVEIAVVLVIIGIAMTLGLGMVTITLTNAVVSETKGKQDQIKQALIAYLRTNGRLPCPDTSDNSTVATGLEVAPCTGSGYGVVPWVTLGIQRELAIDGWGNYFSYRVAEGTSMPNWTHRTNNTPFSINELKTPTDGLTIREHDSAGTALVVVTTKAAVVIHSHGKNGLGAKTTKTAARLPTTGAGTDESTNIGALSYVVRPINQSSGVFNGPFDDVVAYLTPQDLLQPLVLEGSLKSCNAYCPAAPSCSPATEIFSCSSGGGYCTASGVGCTGAGTPSCTGAAIPVCSPPGTGCSAVGIPVGYASVTCL